ncbi:hypothetical protein CALVIDRAFT_294504 [Calocera viscosa TUFC12733]|uniref:Uncharacterized protein n=1 Tax=Calocera viscosa (strain TUFC12733) TaxID=1330018 RepID=A0A167IMA6_CALVF|nr:hypothetical protein CALVIDRAFT_294504 [Calocera viscosa TUFC12733]
MPSRQDQRAFIGSNMSFSLFVPPIVAANVPIKLSLYCCLFDTPWPDPALLLPRNVKWNRCELDSASRLSGCSTAGDALMNSNR